MDINWCPNRECRYESMHISSTNNVVGDATCGCTYWVVCLKCHYQGPKALDESEAVRLHNLISRPSQEPAPVQPVAWMTADMWLAVPIAIFNKMTKSERTLYTIPLYASPSAQPSDEGAPCKHCDGHGRYSVDVYDKEAKTWMPEWKICECRKHSAVSPKAGREESLGSSVCPICGVDTPHYHPPEVVSQHYGTVKSGSLNQNDASPPAASVGEQEKGRE